MFVYCIAQIIFIFVRTSVDIDCMPHAAECISEIQDIHVHAAGRGYAKLGQRACPVGNHSDMHEMILMLPLPPVPVEGRSLLRNRYITGASSAGRRHVACNPCTTKSPPP